MKLVHVCVAGSQPVLSPYGGAVERRIFELSRIQASMGHEVTVFSVGPTNSQRSVQSVSVRHIRCVTPMPWRHAEYLVRLFKRLVGMPRPDVLNFHGQPEGVMIAKALSRPAALFYDNYFFGHGRETPIGPLYRWMLRSFELLLPCSDYCLAESLAYWRLDGRTADVQYNGVNISQFSPNPAAGAAERDRVGISGPVVLYVGRVNLQKGTDLLLESMSMVRQRVPDATLVVAGPISQFGSSVDVREHTSWARRISDVGGVYLGAVHEDRLAAVYNMADVFVMPTRELEMFGMAAVEAQACGIPVVASDHGGLQETVPTSCGARFAVGDPGALAYQIHRLLEDPDLRARCSAAAVENARRYSWDRLALELESHYARAGIHG